MEFATKTMTDSIQQQLVAARRSQILDAAAAVFAQKGFHLTTIRDIARHAGIADGTIYNYFESKPALLLGIFERMRASIVETTPPPPGEGDLHGFIRALVTYPLHALQQDNFALFRIIVSEMLVNDELRTLYYTQVLEPTLHAGEGFLAAHAAAALPDPARRQLVIRAISGMMLGLILERLMGDPVLAEQWDTLPDVLADLIVAGLTGKPPHP
jgi:TetR/AcrR family fatty acid metabolism transcriptional regulator